MRARLRYSVLSPRAPRRYAGYLAGVLLAALVMPTLVVLGYVGPMVTQAAAYAIVAVAA